MSEPGSFASLPLWSVEVTGAGGENRRMLVSAPTGLAEATAVGWWMADHGGEAPVRVGNVRAATPVERKAWEGRADWARKAHRRGKAPVPSASTVALRDALARQPDAAPEWVDPREEPWRRPERYRLGGMFRPSAGWWALGTIVGLLLWVALATWPAWLRVALLAHHVANGGGLWFDSSLIAWVGPWWITLAVFWIPTFVIGTEDWLDGFMQRPYERREHRAKQTGPIR